MAIDFSKPNYKFRPADVSAAQISNANIEEIASAIGVNKFRQQIKWKLNPAQPAPYNLMVQLVILGEDFSPSSGSDIMSFGDWVVVDEGGYVYLVSGDIFHDAYEPIE